MSVLSTHVLDEIRELPGKYPQPRSAVMPALDLAQEELGHLTPEAMSEVAAALELDPGYVEGVATFYSLFHLAPVGQASLLRVHEPQLRAPRRRRDRGPPEAGRRREGTR